MSLMPILSDFFLSEDVKKMFNNKYIFLIGDSVNRSMYKDIVKLYQKNEHLTDHQLKLKGELTFENDRLLEGGKLGTMSNDTTYKEVRKFRTEQVLIRFYFVTRCNSSYLQNICKTLRNDLKKPDVVIMNSCYWDLSRYGPKSVEQYKINLQIGIRSLLYVLPKETVFIWTAALPVSKNIYGGFMGAPGTSNIDQKVRLRVRENTIEANRFAAQIANDLGVDFLDLHYFFRLQQFRRACDGIHWDATAHRRISNLLLHHLCDCWDLPTPGRFVVSIRDPIKVEVNKTEKESVEAVEANSDQAQLNDVVSSDPSSPASSISSIENRDPKKKRKEPPETSVTEINGNNKKQRLDTNNNTISNWQINNNSIPLLLESTNASFYTTQSFFNPSNVINSGFIDLMNVQSQNFYSTAYNFTDNMLNYSSYNFSNNLNPFAQVSYNYYSPYYYSNSFYTYTSNSFNSQMVNNYLLSNQRRLSSQYKLVNKRN